MASVAPADEIEGNLHHALLVLAKFCVFIYIITNLSSKRKIILLQVECEARCTGKTGVEMEAMVGASVAALAVYDMCKEGHIHR